MKLTSWPWRRLLTLVMVAAAFGFLYHTAAANWRELSQFRWEVSLPLLLASIVAHVAVLAFGVGVWAWVLRYFPVERLSYSHLLRIWALSNAAKYIPGSVWQFFAAAHLSRGSGLPGVVALTSMLVHVAITLLAAGTLSVATLPLAQLGLGVGGARAVAVLVCALALLAVHPAVINLALRLLSRVARRSTLVWRGSWLSGLWLLLLANLSWALYGVAYYLFVCSLAPIPANAVARFAGINALSFAAGFVAVLAPGGLGVRESAMTLLLSPLLPAGVAAVVALAARLWSVVAEVALALGGVALAAGAWRGEPKG